MILHMILLAIVSFCQNMVFTGVSRSRNSGDPRYHRYWAYASNGVWFLNFALIGKIIWEPLRQGDWFTVVVAAVVYVLFTCEGSVTMMKYLLKHETGKRKVGA